MSVARLNRLIEPLGTAVEGSQKGLSKSSSPDAVQSMSAVGGVSDQNQNQNQNENQTEKALD
eukprot:3125889-Prorocentrum_lima.AAC.1